MSQRLRVGRRIEVKKILVQRKRKVLKNTHARIIIKEKSSGNT